MNLGAKSSKDIFKMGKSIRDKIFNLTEYKDMRSKSRKYLCHLSEGHVDRTLGWQRFQEPGNLSYLLGTMQTVADTHQNFKCSTERVHLLQQETEVTTCAS